MSSSAPLLAAVGDLRDACSALPDGAVWRAQAAAARASLAIQSAPDADAGMTAAAVRLPSQLASLRTTLALLSGTLTEVDDGQLRLPFPVRCTCSPSPQGNR